jgi:hypothetical protein
MSINLENFVGKKIEKCLINNSKDIMYWKINGRWYELYAEGDCCSSSWYEWCDNASVLQNSILMEFEEYECNSWWKNGDCYYVRAGMLEFKTNKGCCTIELRNNSNDYYRGYCKVRERVDNLPEKLTELQDM